MDLTTMELISIEMILYVCELIGLFWVIFIPFLLFIRFVIYLYQLYSRRGNKWFGGPHTWAVITGCTEGIGFAYSKQLYEKGYNLLLISRNEQKLLKVKEIIQKKYGCDRKIRILVIDFSSSSEAIYQKIENEFEGLDEIHVLVNNVGTNYPGERPEYFTQIPNLNAVIMNLINVNVVAGTRLTALVLPRMEKRGRGIIINMSSFSALFPTPLLTIYSATKVYVDYVSRALQEEYRSKGIIIQSVLPFYVSTNMTNNMQPTFYVPTPSQFVRQALLTVGKDDRTAGYYAHRLWGMFYFWLGVWSRFIGIDFNIKFAYFRLKNIRARIHEKEGPIPPHLTPQVVDQIV